MILAQNSPIFFFYFLFHHIQENCTRKGRRKTNTVHIYARLRLKREKKTETKKLSDYINNICEFARPYERYYSDCMDITDKHNYTHLQME